MSARSTSRRTHSDQTEVAEYGRRLVVDQATEHLGTAATKTSDRRETVTATHSNLKESMSEEPKKEPSDDASPTPLSESVKRQVANSEYGADDLQHLSDLE